MDPPAVPSHWTTHTSDAEVAEWLLSLREAALPQWAVHPKMIAFTDNKQKQRYLDSIPHSEADKIESYKACATISGAVRSITAKSVTLVESSSDNPFKHNAGEAHWHSVGIARAEQQYYIYNSSFDPTQYQGDAPPRIKAQHGCSNVVYLLDVIRSPKTVPVSAVKNAQGKAIKGCGKSIANVWMTGSASKDLNCRTGAASFLRNVVSGQAGVSPIQPEIPNAAGYQWIPVAW